MITISSEKIVRCWALLFLVLASASLTLARPYHHETQPMLMRFCGRELTRVIDESCSTFKTPSYLDLVALNQSSTPAESTPADTNESQLTQRTEVDNTKRDSLLRQCCVIGCTEEDLITFCHGDRNQIAEAALQLRHEDVEMDWLYEFLPRIGAVRE
ncbi:Insulin/IGF/relaxin-like peptide 4 [Daphnia sinensis]|uniref:Insulin/IGF/relaxin-like peptide 4 n=1 Tax=Daphnia sinensis TaxID=1820382 RepID=A0AAD5LJJ9_9CRUS|nr:Insulin/IGF/relaxin-like peptide 4 [Daphnia sinensis]